MVQQIMERTLNLFGHICRMKDNRLVKEVMFGMTEGQTSKGEEDRAENGWKTSRNGAEKKSTHSTGRRRIAARGERW